MFTYTLPNVNIHAQCIALPALSKSFYFIQSNENIPLFKHNDQFHGFSWERVNFCHSTWCCILDFWLKQWWKERDVLVVAEQCSQSQGLSAPPAVLPAKGWGCTSSWEGTQPGLLTWCYAQQQLRVQKKEGGTFRAMAFVFPSNPVWGALLSWKCCLPMGRSKLFPCFSSLAYTAFAFPSKVPLSQLRSPHIFRFSSLYHLKRVSKWLLGAELLPGLNHNNQTGITAILWTVCINTPSQFVLKIKKSPPTPASYQPYIHECKTVV